MTDNNNIMRQVAKRASEDAKAVTGDGYQAIQVDSALAKKIERKMSDVPSALKVRPHKDAGGVEAGREMLNSLHTIESSRLLSKNVSPAHSFEVRYDDDDGTISIQFVPGDESYLEDLDTHVSNFYPNALTVPVEPKALDLSEGRWVTGAEQGLDRYTLHLIRNIDLEGFGQNPWGALTSEMASAARRTNANIDIVCQVLIRPARKPWRSGIDDGPTIEDIKYNLEQDNINYARNKIFPWKKERFTTKPSKKERKAAEIMGDLYGERAWNLNVRVFVSADSKEAAELAVKKVADKFENYYESTTEQRFVPRPLRGHALRKGVVRAVGREWVDQGLYFSEAETAGLVNCMDDQINTSLFDWALANPGEGLPPGMPTYDFELAGVADASEAVKYLTMIEHPEYGDDALWLGFDQATGKPVGLWTKFLNAHTQGTGATRMGKSTLYRNVFSQNVRKGEGGFVITHGKPGEDDDELTDDEELLAEIPDDVGPEDIVFIDTGDDFEKRVRFNLLEIPDDLEAGTAEHTSYMYSMCDDFCAAFAQAGGDDEGLYPLMKGLTRTTTRAMALSGHTTTMLDLIAACSSPDNMGILLEWMEEERINYVRETVKRLKAKSDDDYEPIARRMDEILHNATLRTLLSAREPTVNMQEIVDEGKWIFMRIAPALGETETKFVTSPLVRRAAHAKKMSPNRDPFHVIWDEADKSASVHSNLAKLLSIMGGYSMYFHLIYQAPSNQLPKKLWDATSTQIDSAFSFRTSSDDATQIAKLHSEDIESSDLQHLPRYAFYANLDTESGESANSVMVRGAPPAREMREEHEDLDPLEKEEVFEFKGKCVDVHGAVPESDEERMEISEFYETPPEFDEAGNIIEEGEISDQDTNSVGSPTAADRARILQAVYEEAFYACGDGHEPVPMKETTDRITRRLNGAYDPSTPAQWTALLADIPETRLAREEIEGTLHLRCTPEGKARFTSPAIIAEEDESIDVQSNIGGEKHASLMRDAIDGMLERRLPMTITYQDGDELPDATAEPESEIYHRLQEDDSLDSIEIAELVSEFRESEGVSARWSGCREVYIEAESSTGESAPAQTLTNLSAALNSGKMCLFLCREGVAQKIHEYLFEDPPCMYSYKRVEGAVRLYNKNCVLRVGPNEEQVYRPSGCGDSTWLYFEESDHYELRDSEGEVRGHFDSAEDIFVDVGEYPMSDGEFDDASKWSEVTCPFVPERELPDGWEDRLHIVTVSGDGELVGFGEAEAEASSVEEVRMSDL